MPSLPPDEIVKQLETTFGVKFYKPGDGQELLSELVDPNAVNRKVVSKANLGAKFWAAPTMSDYRQNEGLRRSLQNVLGSQSGEVTLSHGHIGFHIDPAAFEKDPEIVLGKLRGAYVREGVEPPENIAQREEGKSGDLPPVLSGGRRWSETGRIGAPGDHPLVAKMSGGGGRGGPGSSS